MSKKYLFYILTLFFSILIILIFDFILSKTIIKNNHCYNYSEYFYELKKNCKGKLRFKKTFPVVDIYTDDIGLRVGKFNIKKDKKKENIFIFGDSFTYGVGLEYEKTFAGIIEKQLNQYNHFNFGVGSYSPSVYVYKLNKMIKSGIIPKKIIIFLDLSDVMDESSRWQYNESTKTAKLQTNDLYYMVKEKKGEHEHDHSESNFKIIENIISLINYNMRIFRIKTKNANSVKKKVKKSIQASFTYTDQEELDPTFWKNNTFKDGIRNLEKRFFDLQQLSNRYDFDIHLVIYPWAETVEFGQEKFNWSKFSSKLCNHERCQLIDAISAFSKYKSKNKNWITDLYFPNDVHFNEKGAKLLSTIVIGNLK